MVGEQLHQWRDGGRSVGLSLLRYIRYIVARTLELDVTEQGPKGDQIAALAPELATADRAVPVVLKPAVDLSLDNPLLSGR